MRHRNRAFLVTVLATFLGVVFVGPGAGPARAIPTPSPAATITVADPSLRVGETSLVTIVFNTPVTGFDNADLTVANGTLSSVSSSDGGTTWSAFA